MLRSILSKLGLAVASVIFTLLLLEILARTTHLGTGGFWEPYPLYGWRNIPGASGWESCYGECAVHVEINSKGLRNRETTYQKPSGMRRILFLGDSMTAAMQVPLDETFAQVLEQRLNSAEGHRKWEVINAAVNAFGTDNELLFYRLEASKYQPDLVILGIYLANDVYNNDPVLEQMIGGAAHKPYFELTASGDLVLKNFPVQNTDSFFIRLGSFFKRNFQLPRFLAQTLNLRHQVPESLRSLVELVGGHRGASAPATDNNSSNQANPKESSHRIDICTNQYAPQIAEAWAITKALLREVRAEVEASGAKFAVLAIPASPQLTPPDDGKSWYCDQPNYELSQFLDAEGIPYLDLLEPFRYDMLERGVPLYFERDFHMNVNGHQIAGDLLAQFAREQFIEKP
jgi:lysophospholipase L1-like esterase